MKNKLLLFSSTILGVTSLVISPLVVSSCSKFNIEEGDLGRNDQLELLSSEEAKQAILDTWLTNTFITLYSQNILNKENDDVEKTLNYYLTHLTWESPSDETILTSDQKRAFEELIFDAFKFYVTFKSTIVDDNNANPKTYFFTKAIEWKEAEYTSIDENDTILISDFNPGMNYLPPTQSSGPEFEQFKKDFVVLMKVRGTAIYSEVLKLLLSEMYFLHAQEKQIWTGTNYEKLTSNPTSLDYVNAKAFDTKDRFYFLLKYLVEKNPQITWTYSESDYSLETENSSIWTYKQFNNINPTKINNLYETIAPISPDKLVNEESVNLSSELRAYSKVVLNSETTEGDLSNNIETIKTFGDYKVGLLNKNTNQLVSFLELEAINILRTLEGVGVPAINIKTSSLNKTSVQLNMNDFEMKFNDRIGSVVNDKLSLDYGGTYSQKWTLKRISFPPTTSDSNSIHLDVEYTFKYNSKDYKLDYSFDITDWSSDGNAANPFTNAYNFNDSTNSEASSIFPSSISILENQSPTGISYILRILPFFEKTGQIKIGDTYYMLGEFSLKNTIWDSITTVEENGKTSSNDDIVRKLAYFFVMSDSTLNTTIQDYYLFNNFTIESSQAETQALIKELGLTTKTTQDRIDAGIPT